MAEINTVRTSKQTLETLMQKKVEIFNGELGTIKTFQAELQVWERRKAKVFSSPDQSHMQFREVLEQLDRLEEKKSWGRQLLGFSYCSYDET